MIEKSNVADWVDTAVGDYWMEPPLDYTSGNAWKFKSAKEQKKLMEEFQQLLNKSVDIAQNKQGLLLKGQTYISTSGHDFPGELVQKLIPFETVGNLQTFCCGRCNRVMREVGRNLQVGMVWTCVDCSTNNLLVLQLVRDKTFLP